MTNSIKKIDRTTKTIIVTKQFLINASQIGTPEFDLYLKLMEQHPGFTFKEYKITRNPDKQTYGKLTYEVMAEFITAYETDEKVREAVLDEYKIVRNISLIIQIIGSMLVRKKVYNADLCTFGRQRTVPNYIDLDYDKIKDIFDMCM